MSITTLDDVNRYCITLWSDIAFCEDELSYRVVFEMYKSISKPIEVYNVGITHMDDLEIDERLVPKEPYDLVLINPTTFIDEIPSYITDKKTIVIGANPDIPFNKGFRDKADYDNLPRPQFLGLLKNCKRFITNSSSAYYEAPYFLKPEQIILIGNRNKNRSTPTKLEVGASDKIVKIVKKWWIRNEKR